MTHSYLHMKEQFGYEPETLEEKEIKKYIQKQGIGITEEQVQGMIEVKLSDDNTYEPLDSEV